MDKNWQALVVKSGLLNLSHKSILAAYAEINSNQSIVRHRVHKESNCTVIAFVVTTQQQDQREQELVLSVDDIFASSKSLQSSSSSIGINKSVVTLFASYHHELLQLKTQCANSSQMIVTGHSLGGSIASLFALWLLENDHKSKPPLCVTFGAPLLGDKRLQKLISDQPKWNSCFLHVAATLDQVPRLPLNNSSLKTYEPFGMYLFCSESGCCFLELPEAIAEVLVAMNGNLQCSEEFSIESYGKVIKDLESGLIYMGSLQLAEVVSQSLRAGISLQLEGIGFTRQQQIVNVDDLIAKIERMEMDDPSRKRQPHDPGKTLNKIKLNMAQLEWYKKQANNKQTSYYDCYKKIDRTKPDQDAAKHHKFLTAYWIKTIDESENNPRSGVAMSRTRWLYGGTNYKRMVEPFDIADFYRVEGRRGYLTSGRSQHYAKLKEYLAELGNANNSSIDSRRENVDAILTEDSCFWAHVEEALLSCRCLSKMDSSDAEKDLSREDLIKFEKYVLRLMKNYEVSPEIFLPKSSFMDWWGQYEEIKGPLYNSRLTEIMRTNYVLYAKGELEV